MIKKIIIVILNIFIFINALGYNVSAHSGRLDPNGGHGNHQTGTYHFHCGGYPEHQHPNGICRYRSQETFVPISISNEEIHDDNIEREEELQSSNNEDEGVTIFLIIFWAIVIASILKVGYDIKNGNDTSWIYNKKVEEEKPIIKEEKPKTEGEEGIEIFKIVGIISVVMIIITLIGLACL